MKDGDRVTGSIVKKDGATVTIESKNFGLVTVKWDDIATIRTDEALNVVLPEERTVKGNLQTREGRIEVAAAGLRRWWRRPTSSRCATPRSSRPMSAFCIPDFWICG
ncbi:MAG: hypothetical protein IPJ98_07265 [Bryobacterales bacterium]|nr:hypothetical protein [Bryobacterales bacterium]